jgi:hypothetical protein
MIHFDAGKWLRVLDVVPVEEEDSPFYQLPGGRAGVRGRLDR